MKQLPRPPGNLNILSILMMTLLVRSFSRVLAVNILTYFPGR